MSALTNPHSMIEVILNHVELAALAVEGVRGSDSAAMKNDELFIKELQQYAADTKDKYVVKFLNNTPADADEYVMHLLNGDLHYEGAERAVAAFVRTKRLTFKFAFTYLYGAIQFNSETLTALILQVDPSSIAHVSTADEQTPLHAAAQGNNQRILKMVLDAAQARHVFLLNAADVVDYTPLDAAITMQKTDNVRILLRYGADINRQDTDGLTAVHKFIMRTSSVSDITRHTRQFFIFLLENGADVGIVSKANETTVQFAVSSPGIFYLNLLFELVPEQARRIIDVQTMWSGKTALHIAVLYQKEAAVRLLLQNGANRYIRDKGGKTARDLAVQFESMELAELLNDD